MSSRWKVVAGVLALVVAAVAAWGTFGPEPSGAAGLDGVRVVPGEPVEVPGYDRDCGAGRGCVFGQRWSDDVDVAGGHNGCDTRNDILGARLRQVVYKPDTRECVVLAGTLTDPYSGEQVSFRRGETKPPFGDVQIDHI